MPKKDINQLAKFIVDQATGEAPKPKPMTAKQEAGRKGGQIGGKKRMASMTQEEKAKLSAMGVAARKTPTSSGVGVKVAKVSR